MAIKTKQFNDASHLSFSDVKKFYINLNELISDLKELDNNGGNISLPIDVKNLPYEHLSQTYFPNPVLLSIFLQNKLDESGDISSEDKKDFFALMRELFILQYKDIDKYFDYSFKENLISFTHPLSDVEMGAICSLFPEKCGLFLKNITNDTKDWYLQKNKIENKTIDNQNNDDEQPTPKRGKFRNLENSLQIDNTVFSQSYVFNKFVIGDEEVKTEIIPIISIPAFTFLSKIKLLNHNKHSFLYKNKEIFETWLSGQEEVFKSIIQSLDEEQTNFYNLFLSERLSSSNRENFQYLLDKNNVLTVPKLIHYEDFLQGAENPKDATKYYWKYQNNDYFVYFNKIKSAIINEDYNFLEINLPNFSIEDYNHLINQNNEYDQEDNLFAHKIDIKMLKFLDKFNLKPFIKVDNQEYFLLKQNSSYHSTNIEYLKFNPEAQTKTILRTTLQDILDTEVYGLPENIDEKDFEMVLKKKFSFFFEIYNEFIKNNPNINDGKDLNLNFFKATYTINNRSYVKSFLNLFNEHFNENQMFNIMATFFQKTNDNQKIFTGLKDFVKGKKFDLSDSRLAPSYYNTSYTSTTRAKIIKDVSFDINAQVRNQVVWWLIDKPESYLASGIADLNAKNNQGLTFTDISISHIINNLNNINKIKSNKELSYQEEFDLLSANNDANKIITKFDTCICDIFIKINNKDKKIIFSTNSTNHENIPDIIYLINNMMEHYYLNDKPNDVIINNVKKVIDISLSTEAQIKANMSGINTGGNSKTIFGYYQSIFPNIYSSAINKMSLFGNWNEILPSLFDSLPNDKEKDRFFRNMVFLFATNESLSMESSQLKNWEALFSAHQNYDIETPFNFNKLSSCKSLNTRDVFSSTNDFEGYSDILDLSIFEKSLINFLKHRENIKLNHVFVDKMHSSKLFLNFDTTLNIVDLVDIATFNFINENSNDKFTNRYSQYKEGKKDISASFNRFIFANELKSKLKDTKNEQITHKSKKI